MSNIKLTYFPARGRAETSRLILAHAGKKYTDERIDFGTTNTLILWKLKISILNVR